MSSLILAILAVALQAASLFAVMHYAPAWLKTAPDDTRLVAAGLSSVELAFYRYAKANGGTVPPPTLEADGGLSQFQVPARHLAFLPRAPTGFSWRYGYAGDYYICLEATDSAASMKHSLYYGIKRLRQLLPDDQLVISAGSRSCGADVSAAAPSLPAPLSVTYFLRYAPAAGPSAAVFTCSGNACLAENAF
jgi:hypothetical protein